MCKSINLHFSDEIKYNVHKVWNFFVVTNLVLGLLTILAGYHDFMNFHKSHMVMGFCMISIPLLLTWLTTCKPEEKKKIQRIVSLNLKPSLTTLEEVLITPNTSYEIYKMKLERADITCHKLESPPQKIIGEGEFSYVYDYEGNALKLYKEPATFEEILKTALMLKQVPQNMAVPQFKGVVYVASDDSWGICFEKIEGQTLFEARAKNLSVYLVLKGMLDIIKPVRHLDEIGYSHYDLCLQNVMVDRNGQWVLIDHEKSNSFTENSIGSLCKLFRDCLGLQHFYRWDGKTLSWDFNEIDDEPARQDPLKALVSKLPESLKRAFFTTMPTWEQLYDVLEEALALFKSDEMII